MNTKTITSWLLGLYRVCAFAGQREAVYAADSRVLPEGGVLTIQKADRIQMIEVRTGSVWLTGTCGRDIVLHPGEDFALGNQWPYVIEALGASKITLR